jgi:hypothetical protein
MVPALLLVTVTVTPPNGDLAKQPLPLLTALTPLLRRGRACRRRHGELELELELVLVLVLVAAKMLLPLSTAAAVIGAKGVMALEAALLGQRCKRFRLWHQTI